MRQVKRRSPRWRHRSPIGISCRPTSGDVLRVRCGSKTRAARLLPTSTTTRPEGHNGEKPCEQGWRWIGTKGRERPPRRPGVNAGPNTACGGKGRQRPLMPDACALLAKPICPVTVHRPRNWLMAGPVWLFPPPAADGRTRGLSAWAEGDRPMFAAKRVFPRSGALPAANIGTVPWERALCPRYAGRVKPPL
jgi:hypothetical protein